MPLHDFTSAHHSRQASAVKRVLTLVLGVALSGALLLGQNAQAQTAGQEPWKLLEQNASLPVVAEGRSAIVILQMANDASAKGAQPDYAAAAKRGATVSVFIDGSYHASFPRASWAYAEVCPGSHFLNAVQDKTALAVKENISVGQRYEFAVAATSYFQLLEDEKGAPRLQAVDAKAAREVVQQLPKAAHTISRLPVVPCAAPVVAKAPVVAAAPVQLAPVQTRSYTLQAATLFAYDKYTLDALQKGNAEIDAIIRDARANNAQAERIDIKGYADPTGSPAYNQTLSQERANTIAQYFVKAGFARSVVSARGLGATELVVSGCSTRFKNKAQINTCNEPNRRVEVTVQTRTSN